MIIALVFMVGASGAEGGINQTYFTPHLANDFGYSILVITILISSMNLGQIVGPIIFGTFSDRVSRVAVLQTSLVLSGIGTFWIANMGPSELAWGIGLFLFSAVTSSRGTLTRSFARRSSISPSIQFAKPSTIWRAPGCRCASTLETDSIP